MARIINRRGRRGPGIHRPTAAASVMTVLSLISLTVSWWKGYPCITWISGAAAVASAAAVISMRPKVRERKDIMKAGAEGEEKAAGILSRLPQGYTVFQNIKASSEGKTWEMDNVVVGGSGVFVIETKNHRGRFTGRYRDIYWKYEKFGRNYYVSEVYNPLRQVDTHVRLLSRYLSRCGIDVTVRGMVLFTNPACRLRIDGRGKTWYYDSGEELVETITEMDTVIDKNEIRRIFAAIEHL